MLKTLKEGGLKRAFIANLSAIANLREENPETDLTMVKEKWYYKVISGTISEK